MYMYLSIMSRDANNVLLGGGVRVRVSIQRKFKGKIKGTTKPLMAFLNSIRNFTTDNMHANVHMSMY